MHLTRELLYLTIAFLSGGLLGVITGVCLLGAWLKGWIFPVTIPEHLKGNSIPYAGDGEQ